MHTAPPASLTAKENSAGGRTRPSHPLSAADALSWPWCALSRQGLGAQKAIKALALPRVAALGSGDAHGSKGFQGKAVLEGQGGWERSQPGITAPLTDAGMGSKANTPCKTSLLRLPVHCPLV